MVFGMISEKMRMSSVMMAETSPNHWLPNRMLACWPTPAAPTVFAIVFRERMAVRGRSGLSLSFAKMMAFRSPSSSFMEM